MRGPVVQPLVPPVLDIREHVAQRRPVAGQFVGDHHPRHIREALEQLPEEAHGRALVAPGLHQDVAHVAALVDRPPKLVLRAIDADEHLVQVPLIARARASAAQCVRIGWPNFWHHCRLVSYVRITPRSASSSSTSR